MSRINATIRHISWKLAVAWGVLALAFALWLAPAPALADDDAASGESPAMGNVLVDAGYELENCEYTVEITMEGGSGRASIESPTILTVEGGNPYITITWSSENYDYMMVGGTKYRPIATKPTSRFVVPLLAIDEPFEMSADTTAMGTPHEIEYTFTVDGTTLEKVVPESAGEGEEPGEEDASGEAAASDAAASSDASAAVSGEAASSDAASAASASASASSASASAASSDASQASAASESATSTVSKAEATDDKVMIIAIASLIIATIAIAVMVGVLRGYSQRN